MAKLPSLLSLASYSGQVEAEFVAELTLPERQAAGAPDDWAAKDLLAHVTTWRERGAEDLKAILRGPLPPEPQEFDEVNRAIFDQNRGQAWEVVLGRVKKSWDVFTMSLRDLTEDMLAASGSEAQPVRPLWRRVTVEAGNHPVLHYAEFARRRGRGASATQWMEGLSPLLLAVDPAGLRPGPPPPRPPVFLSRRSQELAAPDGRPPLGLPSSLPRPGMTGIIRISPRFV